MSNNKDFKVKNGIQPTAYHEAVGTVVSGSVGYNLAGASYDGVSFSVAGQESNPTGLFFKPDGTKMYVLGNLGDNVNEYDLSTPWDVSTASFLQLFSVAAQDPNLYDLFFKPDGTKMYGVGVGNDNVYEYNLSTPWDITTASYLQLFSVAAQETGPGGVFFKPDGTKMYITGSTGDDVNEYNLSTPWDISTASFLQLFSVSAQDTFPSGLFFKPDGTIMYVLGNTNDSVYEYNLSTPWSVTTASFLQSFSVTAQETTPLGITFKPDGTNMYIVGAVTKNVYQYSTVLSTASLDLSTGSVFEITPTSNLQVTLSNPAASGTSSGATLLLSGSAASTYDLSALSYDSKSFSTASQSSNPYGLEVKPDGTAFYVLDITDRNVYQYVVSSPTDITTATYASKSLSTGSQDTSPRDITFKTDGTRLYMVGATNDRVYQYNLSTAWDVSTASYGGFKSIATEDGFPAGIRFSQDGTKMILLGGSNILYQYTLSTAWSVSTASYDSVSFSVATQAGNGEAMTFKPDGTEFYIGDWGDDAVYKYNLSTPWNLSTASYSGTSGSLSAGAGTTRLSSLQFLNSGESLYILDGDVDTIYQYSTATGTTITYDTSLQWSGGTAPTAPAIGDTDVLTFNTTDGGTTYKSALAIDGAS